MDWLKEILEKAVITDGKLDIESVISLAQKEFPKYAVPKKVFNDKNEELKIANETIITLKKDNGDNSGLQQKVTDYETEIGKLKKAAEDTTKTFALKEALTKADVLDVDYLIYKHGGIEKFVFDKDNKPVGIEDAIKPYKEDKALSHLFKAAPGADYTPTAGGNPPAKNPFASDSFNLTEQGRMLKENPEQARQLASAAGVKI